MKNPLIVNRFHLLEVYFLDWGLIMKQEEFYSTIEKLYKETDPDSVSHLSMKAVDLLIDLPPRYQAHFAELLLSERLPSDNLEELVSMIYDFEFEVENISLADALEHLLYHSSPSIAVVTTFSLFFCLENGYEVIWENIHEADTAPQHKEIISSILWHLIFST